MEPLKDKDPRHIARYRLVGRIGGGGMGQVYLARSASGRQLAVKVIHPEIMREDDFRARFAREVAAARAVGGVWTAAIVDADVDADPAWIATEFVPGPSLAQAVAGTGPLTPHSQGVLMLGLSEALAAIHRVGLVHRDLKPANVLLGPDGPRVIDFGIARSFDASALTGSRHFVGTPGFMAPEQLLYSAASAASDVFCLGLTMAFAAHGRPPYGTGTWIEVSFRIVNGLPDLAGVPDGLLPLVLSCVEKDPADRPSVAELLDRLTDAAPVAVAALRSADPWQQAPALDAAGPVVDAVPAGADAARPTEPPLPRTTPPTLVPQPPALPGNPSPRKVRQRGRVRYSAATAGIVAVLAAAVALLQSGGSGGPAAATGSQGSPGAGTAVQDRADAATPSGGFSTRSSSFDAALTSVVNPSTATGGTLNLVSTDDVDSFDGTRSYAAGTWDLQRLFLRGLMAYDAKPGVGGAKVVPDLATAPGRVSADGLTVTYTLRNGIEFQDGSPITSKDIKYGIERSFSPGVLTGGPVYAVDLLSGYQGQTYPGVYADTDPDKLGLKAVETPDAKTIVFHLNRPFADWDYVMALPISSPVPVKADQQPATGGANYQVHVVSSGPYMFQSYDPGRQVVWVRNPHWSKATDPIRSQLPDKIVLTEGVKADEIDQRVLDGTADIEVQGEGVQSTFQSQIMQDPALKKNADNPVTGTVRYFAINTQVPELQNVHCRRAVEWAADKATLQAAQGPIGGGQIATTFAAPTLADHTVADAYPGGPDDTGDLSRARTELAACGRPGGFSTTIASTDDARVLATATALQTALARVGIKATIHKFPSAGEYRSTYVGIPSNVHSNDLGIMATAWAADWPDGYSFYSATLDGRKILQNGSNVNLSEENDPQMNALLDELETERDPAVRVTTTARIEKLAMDDAVVLPATDDLALLYRSPRVTNVYVTNAFGAYDIVNMGVAAG